MIKQIIKNIIGIGLFSLFFLGLVYLVYLMWYFAFIFLDRTTNLWCVWFMVSYVLSLMIETCYL